MYLETSVAVDERGRGGQNDWMCRGLNSLLLALKREEGPMSQRTCVTSRSWKRQGNEFSRTSRMECNLEDSFILAQ
jgi:hypothetical protein